MKSRADGTGRTGRARRAYCLLLRLYPGSHLERFEDEMLETFVAAYTDPALSGVNRARFWVREIWGVLRTAALERWGALTNNPRSPLGRAPGYRPNRPGTALPGVKAALPSLRRNPGFTVGAAVLIGIGAGVATLMFSIVDSVVLKPLDIPEADRVVQVQGVLDDGTRASLLPVSLVQGFVDSDDVFAEVAMFNRSADILATDTEVRMLVSYVVTANFFPMVGARVIAGRGLQPADYEPDAPRVAVLGHAFWQRRYGGDLDVVGDQLPLELGSQNKRPATIVGILAADFRFPPLEADVDRSSFANAEPPDIVRVGPHEWISGQRGFAAGVLARLSEGVTLEQARSKAEALASGFREIRPQSAAYEAAYVSRGVELSSLPELLQRHYGAALYIFWAASALLLLIACANIASLVTARGLMRGREMAVRASLGADRGRLFVQLLAESAVLGVLGGLIGGLIAYAGVRGLVSIFPGDVYRLTSAGLDARALGFLAVASLVPPLAFGSVPAWLGSASAQSGILRSNYLGPTAGRARVLRGFVIAQIGLALMVVTGGSLLVRTNRNLSRVDLGFDTERVLTFSLATFPGSYSKYAGGGGGRRLIGLVLDRLASVPGVVSASNGVSPPFPPAGMDFGSPWMLADPTTSAPEEPEEPEEGVRAGGWAVGPGYFETLGVDIVAGRSWNREEWERALGNGRTANGLEGEAFERYLTEVAQPVVINETMAVRFWGDPESALGSSLFRRLRGNPVRHEVIGVVRDIRARAHDTEPLPQVFRVGAGRDFAVRTAIDPLAVAADIRRTVEGLDPVELSITSLTTIDERVAAETVEERFRMQILVLAAGLALAIAAVGVFGVMVYSVGRRTHEIAVRMSLGARMTDVIRLLGSQNAWMILVGIVGGLFGAVAVGQSMESLLFGVPPLDFVSFAASALLLAVVCAGACYLPTLRAATVDPVEVLKND